MQNNESIIPLQPTRSPYVQAIGYDEASKILAVIYKGTVRYFRDVPEKTCRAFMASLTKKDMFEKVILRDYREFWPSEERGGAALYVPEPDAEFRRETAVALQNYRDKVQAMDAQLKRRSIELLNEQKKCADLAAKLKDSQLLTNDTQHRLRDALSLADKRRSRARLAVFFLLLSYAFAALVLPQRFEAAYQSGYAAGVEEQSRKDAAVLEGYKQGYRDGQDSSVSAVSPKSSASSTVTDADKTMTVYVTDTGTKYHRAGCGYLHSQHELTLGEAIEKGYTACSRCWK